jgi:hypothetical protein
VEKKFKRNKGSRLKIKVEEKKEIFWCNCHCNATSMAIQCKAFMNRPRDNRAQKPNNPTKKRLSQ